MSGVFGIAQSDQRPLQGLAHRMAESLRLMEWTRSQVWCADEAQIALGQVNIGVFASSAQPVFSADKRRAVVFFGELYQTSDSVRGLDGEIAKPHGMNHAELILALYEELGESLLERLDGVFVLAIWDGMKKTLLLANDRFGLLPLYYAHYDGKLIFAPEVKAILEDDRFTKKLDMTGLAQFMRFQRLLGSRTFFEDIHLLPYGSMLTYDARRDSTSISHYWDFDHIQTCSSGISFDEAVEETGRLVRQAIETRLDDEFRVGVYLSGGLDSRTVLAFASQVRSPIDSITYGVPDSKDVHYARKIARRVGSPHHEFVQTDGRWMQESADIHLEVTEGTHTWVHGHAGSTLMPARAWIDVNLTGYCGDALLGARMTDYALPLLTPADDFDFIRQIFYHLNQDFSWPGITEAEEKQLYSEQVYQQIRDRAYQSLKEEMLASCLRFEGYLRIEYLSFIVQSTRMSNINQIYTRPYFEVRYPFNDHQLTDFVLSIPIEYRYRDRLYLAVINREIPEVVPVPRDRNELPLVENRTLMKWLGLMRKAYRQFEPRKLRTIHEDPEGWLRRDLREWAQEIVLGSRTVERGIFNPSFLSSIFHRHMSGNEVHTIGKIGPIMTSEMMLRRFFD